MAGKPSPLPVSLRGCAVAGDVSRSCGVVRRVPRVFWHVSCRRRMAGGAGSCARSGALGIAVRSVRSEGGGAGRAHGDLTANPSPACLHGGPRTRVLWVGLVLEKRQDVLGAVARPLDERLVVLLVQRHCYFRLPLLCAVILTSRQVAMPPSS